MFVFCRMRQINVLYIVVGLRIIKTFGVGFLQRNPDFYFSKFYPNLIKSKILVGNASIWTRMLIADMGLTSWFQKKIIDPLLLILRRGAEPNQLAFSAALGITLGIFPICGVTVFLCGMAIALLGSFCHAPTVMLANFIATPIELSLVVPFLRFGEVISRGPHFPLTSDALKKVLTGQASHEVLSSISHALLGWLAASPFILGTLYIVFIPCFKFLVRKFGTVPLSPKKMPNLNTEVRLKVRDV